MLSEDDLVFMKDAKDEIYELRKRDIKLLYKRIERDPITGVIIGEEIRKSDAQAVVTEISSVLPDKSIEGGIEFDEPDIKIDIKLYEIEDLIDDLVKVEYRDREYEIVGNDRKGIGIRDRVELLGRAIA